MKRANRFLFLSIVCFFLFSLITILLLLEVKFVARLNVLINETVNLDFGLVSVISFFGSPLFTILFFLLFVIIFYQSYRREIYYSWILFIGAGIHYFLKEFLAFQRPENLILFTPGYPSGHSFYSALVYWSIAGLIGNKNKFVASIFIIMPFIIGLTRLFLGVHWLTDVIGGLLFGAGWVFVYFYAIYYYRS